MKRSIFLLAAILIPGVCISGCGSQEDLKKADAAVAKFHAQLDAGNFAQIYSGSDGALKSATSQQKFVELLSAIHRKLGPVKNAERQGFFINWSTSGFA
jgi:hypothetical protein